MENFQMLMDFTTNESVSRLNKEEFNMWDDADNINNLRLYLAKIIASKSSGLPFEDVTPEQRDFDLADSLSDLIDKELEGGLR